MTPVPLPPSPAPRECSPDHHLVPADQHHERPLVYALALTASFCLIELGGGLWTRSLALIADSMHMAVDALALVLALFATVAAAKPADERRTFGYKRVEVLAALGNGIGLMVLTGFILREALARLAHPHPINAQGMLLISSFGLVSNIASGFFLYAPSRQNINMRGAFLHVGADALGSLAAIAAAAVILKTHWLQADSVAGILISAGIIFTAFWLLRDSTSILLESAPPHLDIDEIRAALAAIPGVREVHDLHLWSLSPGYEFMSGHIVAEESVDRDALLDAARRDLTGRFGLSHVTLQVEGKAVAERSGGGKR